MLSFINYLGQILFVKLQNINVPVLKKIISPVYLNSSDMVTTNRGITCQESQCLQEVALAYNSRILRTLYCPGKMPQALSLSNLYKMLLSYIQIIALLCLKRFGFGRLMGERQKTIPDSGNTPSEDTQ